MATCERFAPRRTQLFDVEARFDADVVTNGHEVIGDEAWCHSVAWRRQGHVWWQTYTVSRQHHRLGLQFLSAGARRGEQTLWITLSETERQLRQSAHSHGWSLDGVEVCNPVTPERVGQPDEKYSFFSPADVELEEIRNAIAAAIERVQPSRVVFDPFSDIRHLAREVLHYRRQVLSLREFFNQHGCTVLLMQELTRGMAGDLQAEALVHGYLTLHQDAPEYGGQRRRLRVHKMRGMTFRDGFHDFSIQTGGIEVYPRLIAAEHVEVHAEEGCRNSTRCWAVGWTAGQAC
jgi:circadian clock protein KaiC